MTMSDDKEAIAYSKIAYRKKRKSVRNQQRFLTYLNQLRFRYL